MAFKVPLSTLGSHSSLFLLCNMDYHHFPSHNFSASRLQETVTRILGSDVNIGDGGGSGLVLVSTVAADGECHDFHIPSFYEKYFKLIVYRLHSLALVLKYWDELCLSESDPTSMQQSRVTLSQHLIYFNGILKTVSQAVEKGDVNSNWRCLDLDRFLVTELVVKRHEPIFVYAYRLSRKDGDPNISTCNLEGMGERLLVLLPQRSHVCQTCRIIFQSWTESSRENQQTFAFPLYLVL
ncbi:hypothetical protein JVU11DRAFT_11558 [Chiua virens]|nr:hypothetical protein JVU11DRAFT_11558 [Chiua virens]